jgi:NAD(P) transhydrogenase subunit alpha
MARRADVGSTRPVVSAVRRLLFCADRRLYAPAVFLGHFTVFVLACFIGYMVVWNVTPALAHAADERHQCHSSIIAIGALVQIAPPRCGLRQREPRPDVIIRWLASSVSR